MFENWFFIFQLLTEYESMYDDKDPKVKPMKQETFRFTP